ncbi:hypothetical protein AAES_46546 [Amazona aestiva]|uniref:Uncharacterized protein n=1 Tax=Amazona aestiva TaxID=12930 RepID=A0A0Q3PTZ1_AMAAE|nr:hypothetical protein AAES_46546 [Amazona aestiva]
MEKVHGDMDEVYGDMEKVHGDMDEVYGDMEMVHGDMDEVHGDMDEVYGDMEKVHGDTEEVYGNMDEVYGAMEVYGATQKLYRDEAQLAPEVGMDPPISGASRRLELVWGVSTRNSRTYPTPTLVSDGIQRMP